MKYSKFSLLKLKENDLFKSNTYLYFIWFKTYENYKKYYNFEFTEKFEFEYVNIDTYDKILFLDKKRFHNKKYKYYMNVYKLFTRDMIFWMHLDLEKTFELIC